MQKIGIILSYLLILGILTVNCENETSFTVAVVEYQPSNDPTKNFENYYSAINSVPHVDFIIFPESTFSNETFEVSKTEAAPNCSANDPITKIRCLAKDKSTYVIINLSEKVPCNQSEQSCPNSGQLIHNSNIIIGKSGSIIEKYRKWNLFGETNINKTAQPEIVSIDTDKGKFGIFTCFDILFQVPALNLTKLGVKNFIFPSMWYSELPFLTALQTQQMWAYQNNVTLFSAGANNLSAGSGGSGIFLGDQGILNMTIGHNLNVNNYQILTGNMLNSSIQEASPTEDEIDKIGENLDNLKLLRDDLSNYASVIINKTDSVIKQMLCDKSQQLCCTFNISLKYSSSASKKSEYIYRLVAYTGVRSFSGVYNGGIEVCGIVSCIDNNITSCSERLPGYKNISWDTTFENINITGTFNDTDSRLQFPNSLLSSIRPISPQFTSWKRTLKDNKTEIEYSLKKPQTRLLTFAIYGRNFNNDGAPTPAPAVPAPTHQAPNSTIEIPIPIQPETNTSSPTNTSALAPAEPPPVTNSTIGTPLSTLPPTQPPPAPIQASTLVPTPISTRTTTTTTTTTPQPNAASGVIANNILIISIAMTVYYKMSN